MKPKILIVDDEPNILRLLEYNLKQKYDVVLKNDGLEAMLWLQDGNVPNLIVTDVMMPNMNGFELMQNIRNSGFFKNIPIIFLTAKSDSVDRVKGLKEGADDYLVKPFNPEELDARIENLLRRINGEL
ncbi:MAG: response regulator [Bacteroidales bacterium]|nr:response regulator [Bacteroidales bacterium]